MPLVLIELPKYCDKIKTQSALDSHKKNIFGYSLRQFDFTVFFTVLWCTGTWYFEKIQSDNQAHEKKKSFLATVVL